MRGPALSAGTLAYARCGFVVGLNVHAPCKRPVRCVVGDKKPGDRTSGIFGSPAILPVSGICGTRHRVGSVALRPHVTVSLPFRRMKSNRQIVKAPDRSSGALTSVANRPQKSQGIFTHLGLAQPLGPAGADPLPVPHSGRRIRPPTRSRPRPLESGE